MGTTETKKYISSSIWRMSEEALSIEDELIQNGGELTPELEERLQMMGENNEQTIDSIATLMNKVKSDNDVIADEIKRLQDLKKAREKTIDAVKEAMRKFMLNNGIDRIETPTHVAKITKGRAKVEFSESLEMEGYDKQIEDFAKTLPPYIQIKSSISKTELKKWVEDGHPTRSADIICDPSIQIK